ncbi:outer membrane protein [Aminobacter sp. MET-1]|uniref:outer membrane protein n=1 Tax=Aminobacter sp. MET-1 TaxID=2951085 RepID=UPI002269D9EC|nr:outer membrane protein [Aminobacter sp. MET-1]MCX8570430.1 porin family protein [Aminobacter sp. MET-1]
MKSTALAIVLVSLAAGTASAADVVASEPVPTSVGAPFVWTGGYIGLQLGYSKGSGEGAYLSPGGVRAETASPDARGALLGGQVGYNHQWGSMVVGVEGELAYSWANGTSDIVSFPVAGGPIATNDNEFTYLGSITGRLGYAMDRTLFYVKGGVGFTKLSMSDISLANTVNASGSETLTGWTVGAGIEQALNEKWSIRGEYQFYRFDANLALNEPALFRTYDDNFDIHAFKLGINYRF